MVNVFILSEDSKRSARYMFDSHIVKCILEGAQIFFTARHLLGIKEELDSYRPAHKYHGAIKWVMNSYANYVWLFRILASMNHEYKYRNKSSNDHKSFSIVRKTFFQPHKTEIKHLFKYVDCTPPYQAMPFIYQQSPNEYVLAYRTYYFYHKRYYLPSISWKNRNIPYWFCNEYFYTKGIFHFNF